MADKPGPTGDFPYGKLRSDDRGALNAILAVDRKKKVIVLDFTTPVQWLAMTPKEAVTIARQIIHAALDLDPGCIERFNAKKR